MPWDIVPLVSLPLAVPFSAQCANCECLSLGVQSTALCQSVLAISQYISSNIARLTDSARCRSLLRESGQCAATASVRSFDPCRGEAGRSHRGAPMVPQECSRLDRVVHERSSDHRERN